MARVPKGLGEPPLHLRDVLWARPVVVASPTLDLEVRWNPGAPGEFDFELVDLAIGAVHEANSFGIEQAGQL